MALIYFARVEKCDDATTISSDYYRFALAHTRTAISEINDSNVPDELILTAVLLASYEDKLGGHDHLTFIPNSFQHGHGAAALVVRRINHSTRTRQNRFLDTLVREQNIKTCLNQSIRVPENLCHCDKFLPTPNSREMANCMIRAAELQSRRRAAANYTTVTPSIGDLRDILATAQQVDRDVSQLQQRLPSFSDRARYEWPTHLHNDPLFSGCETLHEYNDVNEARMWNDSRAIRLRMSRVIVSIGRLIEAYHAKDFDAATRLAITQAEEVMSSSAEDVFAAMPYHFGQRSGTAFNSLGTLSQEVAAIDAGLQTFALVSVAMSSPPASQHARVAVDALLRVARIHGNIILERLCTSGGPLAKRV